MTYNSSRKFKPRVTEPNSILYKGALVVAGLATLAVTSNFMYIANKAAEEYIQNIPAIVTQKPTVAKDSLETKLDYSKYGWE